MVQAGAPHRRVHPGRLRAFWLGRASLAIGGRAEDVLISVFGAAVIGVFSYAIRVTAGTAPPGRARLSTKV